MTDLLDQIHYAGQKDKAHIHFTHDARLIICCESSEEGSLCFRVISEVHLIASSNNTAGLLAGLSCNVIVNIHLRLCSRYFGFFGV